MNDASATRVLHERHECNTSDKIDLDLSEIDFDNRTSKNVFSRR